jgi:hypothetical protein
VTVGAGSTAESTRASVEHGLLGAASRQLVASHEWNTRLGVRTSQPDHTLPLARDGPGVEEQPPLRERESGAALCLGIPSSVC